MDEENIKQLREVKERVHKTKNNIIYGEVRAIDVDLCKYLDDVYELLHQKTLYVSAEINLDIIEIFNLKIEFLEKLAKRSLEENVGNYQIVEVVSLPIASIPRIITLEQSVPKDVKLVKVERRKEQTQSIRGEGISISLCKYKLKDEKNMLLEILRKGKISIHEWLLSSKDKEEYVVRIVALGELLNSGKVRIREDMLLEINWGWFS